MYRLKAVKIWLLSNLVASPNILFRVRELIPIRIYSILLVAFIIGLSFAAYKTEVKSIGILGDTGRNLGLLHFLSLVIISFYCALNINLRKSRFFFQSSIFLGFLLGFYGALQHFHLDFLHWDTPYNSLILTVGNPDFSSSLLSVFTILTFAALLFGYFDRYRYLLALLVVLLVCDVYWTRALQGLICILFGITFIIILKTFQRNKSLGISLTFIAVLFGSTAFFGALKIGPFSRFLYKSSVTDRGYDWSAAFVMFKSHPWFGVGVDRFGSYFPQYKDSNYSLLYGYDQTVTNAHNAPLQIFATAGVFVGVFFCSLLLAIAVCCVIALRRYGGNEQILVGGLVAAWAAIVFQSLISPEALSISSWGWALGGSIVALSSSNSGFVKPTSTPRSRQSTHEKSRNFVYRRTIIFSLGSIALTFLIVPIERNEILTYKLALTTVGKDSASVGWYKNLSEEAFNGLLMNPNYKATIALALGRNNFGPEALEGMKRVIKADSKNLLPYSYLAKYYEHFNDPVKAIQYRTKLANLDPWNADNLLELETDLLAVGKRDLAENVEVKIVEMGPQTVDAAKAQALINGK